MADFVTSVSTIAGLRSWWDSTIPATVNAGDNYIADLAPGSYDISTVSDTWGGKTVASGGQIIIRAATAAKLTSGSRALNYNAADGARLVGNWVGLSLNSSFTVLEGLQITSNQTDARLYTIHDVTLRRCILNSVMVQQSDTRILIEECVVIHPYNACLNLQAGNATVINTTCLALGSSGAFYCGASSPIVKNSAFLSATADAAWGAGVWDASSTNNAFNVGPTRGAAALTIASASEFENVASGPTADLRLKAGSSLASAGVSGVGLGTDVYNQTRTAPYSIGAYELNASGASATFVATTADATFAGGGIVRPMASFAITAASSAFSGGASVSASSASFSVTTAGATLSGGAIGSTVQGTLSTPPLKNNSGTLLVGETGITAYVYNVSTGALVVAKTGLITDGSGVVAITDPAISAGTTYRVVVVLSSGAEGMDKVTAA